MVLAQVDDVQQDALVPLRVLHSEVEPKSETCNNVYGFMKQIL